MAMTTEVARSLEALALNARRLLNDAEIVLIHGSHQTAASLAILANDQSRSSKARSRRAASGTPIPSNDARSWEEARRYLQSLYDSSILPRFSPSGLYLGEADQPAPAILHYRSDAQFRREFVFGATGWASGAVHRYALFRSPFRTQSQSRNCRKDSQCRRCREVAVRRIETLRGHWRPSGRA
jgi:hypothetical protein